MVASHLLKWAHTSRDNGFKPIDLYFIKNKEKEEADFLILHDRKPSFLIEAKFSDQEPSKAALKHSHKLSSIPVVQLVDKQGVYLRRKFDKTTWTVMSASRFFSGTP